MSASDFRFAITNWMTIAITQIERVSVEVQ